jgi:hypothetical protein
VPLEDFDAARRAYAQARGEQEFDPVQFALCGEVFTALREPMWGDVLQLWDAPEIDQDEARAILAMQKFIRAMITPDDRPRFDAAMFRLPHSEAAFAMMEVAAYITRHMTGFPSMPPDSSAPTPPSTGEIFNESSGGATTSSSSPPPSDVPSPTGTSSVTSTTRRSGKSTASSNSSPRKK